MRDRYLTVLVVGLIAAVLVPTLWSSYQGSLATAERAGYEQAAAATQTEDDEAPADVQQFIRAFCENDAEAIAPFIPPQYLASIQQVLAVGAANGDTCVSINYLGSDEIDGTAIYVYVLDQGTEKNWWIISWQDGLAVNIE